MTPLAHVGHWYINAVYVLPLLVVGALLWWSGRRERSGDNPNGPREDE